ncbi:MAG: Lrp/AsnC family transcriptional regulator [Hyphomicrobiaceae bacterium]
MTTAAPVLTAASDSTEVRLLEDFQRDFPLEPRPFAAIAQSLGIAEASVIVRLETMQHAGLIARVGGVVRPNTVGASTLAAVAAPALSVDAVADVLAQFPGINHIYMRENALNLWFVVTGPDTDHVATTLLAIEHQTGLRVFDLRLERAYHIDLGFSLIGRERRHGATSSRQTDHDFALEPRDRALVQVLTEGLPLVPRPFKDVADRIGLTEAAVIARLRALTAAGIVPRIGVIVRHRALGWRSNAMVVWDVAPDDVDRIGAALAEEPGITLCYRRTRYARGWPYNLYCMVHARTREQALDTVVAASEAAELGGRPRRILFSLKCYKQTGALVARQGTN